MARIEIGTKNFEEARKELASIGIILYRKEHRKGGYICRASRTLRESIARTQALKELPKDNIYIHGKI